MGPITFPGLGLSFNIQRVAFTIFGRDIYWYGIIIAVGLLLALIYGMKRAKDFGITVDDLSDIVIISVIAAIIFARLYYVLFYIDSNGSNPYLSDPISILWIWNGGLAIYGGIIGALLAGFFVCKHKKINPLKVYDLAALGLLIGQAIGRWGNFVNREAFGSETGLPWGMSIDGTSTLYHPAFLYESLWCIIGFILLHIYSKRRKFDGEIFLMYAGWYSFERFFVEGLRTDSLMLGNIRISQLLSAAIFIASITILCILYTRKKKTLTEENADYKPLYADTAEAMKEEAKKQGTGAEEDTSAANSDETEKSKEQENISETPTDIQQDGKTDSEDKE